MCKCKNFNIRNLCILFYGTKCHRGWALIKTGGGIVPFWLYVYRSDRITKHCS